MKKLLTGLILLSVASVGLKLLTYEFRYVDSPTVGVAVRCDVDLDALARSSVLQVSERPTCRVLTAGENDYIGQQAYLFIVKGAWLGILLVTAGASGVLLWRRRRARSRSPSSAGSSPAPDRHPPATGTDGGGMRQR